MQIVYFDKLDSTQIYIKNNLSKLKLPILVYTNNQTNGIGSRENKWVGEKGNLFFSFAIDKSYFSRDIPLHSLSIYIGIHIKSILNKMESKVFLKWPNDLYIENKKIGGIITHIKEDNIIIGCGINSISSKKFGNLTINFDDKVFLENLIHSLEEKIKWKTVFELYKKEFYKNAHFTITHNSKKVSLKNAVLKRDGSITINGEKILNDR